MSDARQVPLDRFPPLATVEVTDLGGLGRLSSAHPGARRGTTHSIELICISDAGQERISAANTPAGLSAPIERDTVWRQRIELDRLLRGLLGDRYSARDPENRELLLLDLVTRLNRSKLGPDASEADVLRAFFRNSQSRFESVVERNVGALLRDRPLECPKPYADGGVGSEGYSHIRHFGWLYAIEIRHLIALVQSRRRRITVVDDATGFGHFVLTAHHVLQRLAAEGAIASDAPGRVHYIAFDKSDRDMRFARERAAGSGVSAEWRLWDIGASDRAARFKSGYGGRKADLLVSNHAIEHLDTVDPARYVLDSLKCAHRVFVSVPLEDGLGLTVAAHVREYTRDSLVALSSEVRARASPAIGTLLENVDRGLLAFATEPADPVDGARRIFGEAAVRDIESVYSETWGRDSFREKGAQPGGSRVDPAAVLTPLAEIANADDDGHSIAQGLAEALRYSRGLTDSRNYMRPVDAGTLTGIAARWRGQLEEIRKRIGRACESWPEDPFPRICAEWRTYVGCLEEAKRRSGKPELESFGGIAQAAAEAAWRQDPRRPLGEAAAELDRGAREAFEAADLLGAGRVFSGMRIQPEDILERLRRGAWIELLEWAVSAQLYGEGRTYQSLRLMLDSAPGWGAAGDFWKLADLYLQALQPEYRRTPRLEDVPFEALRAATTEFLAQAGGPVDLGQDFDFDEAWLAFRQEDLRSAERHLQSVEDAYASFQEPAPPERDVAACYGRAMDRFLAGWRGVRCAADTDLVLGRFRQDLLAARRLADRNLDHDFFYWSGPGEHPGQVVGRTHHPRYRLYHVEAVGERMYFAAARARTSTLAAGVEGGVLEAAYHAEYAGASALYVQELIGSFGPRRVAIFGHAPAASVAENGHSLSTDAWIHGFRAAALRLGVASELLGPLVTGYTERLRDVLRDEGRSRPLRVRLARLVEEGAAQAVLARLRQCENSFDAKDAPLVTAGVHLHDAKPEETLETLVHLRELEWPHRRRWTVLSSTSSDPAIAAREQALALSYGVSRVGISLRQHLKAGNQNRTIPNVPLAAAGETFYLTLDDDYRPAPRALARLVPRLLERPRAAYVQVPLVFRAAFEPGHSAGRRLDGLHMAAWTATVGPSFNDLDARPAGRVQQLEDRERASVAFPFGTGTLYRLTPGRCLLRATGGVVYDPQRMTEVEDLTTGVVSSLMRIHPELYHEVRDDWEDGILLSETWIIGDSVDFAPGNQLQKGRWAEGGIRTLRQALLPAFWKLKGIGRFRPRAVLTAVYVLANSVPSFAAALLSYLVFPLTAFTWVSDGVSNPLWLAYALLAWGLGVAIEVYIGRFAGFSLREVLGRQSFWTFGTSLHVGLGALRGALTRPSGRWAAAKRGGRTATLRATHTALLLLNASALAVALSKGAWVYALLAVNVAFFALVLSLYEAAPGDQHEKIRLLVRDAKDTAWRQACRRISFGSRAPGLSVYPRHARPVWILSSVCSMLLISGLSFSLLSTADTSAVAVLVIFLATSERTLFAMLRILSLWLSVKGIENSGPAGPNLERMPEQG